MPEKRSPRARVLALVLVLVLVALVAAAVVYAAPDLAPARELTQAPAFAPALEVARAPAAINADPSLELAIISSPYAIVDHNQPDTGPAVFVVEAVITNTGSTTAVLPYMELDYNEGGDWQLLETETVRRTPELAKGEAFYAYWFATYPLQPTRSHVYTVTAGVGGTPLVYTSTNAFMAGDTVRTIKALEGGTTRLEDSTTDIVVGAVFTLTVDWSLGNKAPEVLLSPVGNVGFDPASYRLVAAKITVTPTTTGPDTFYDRLYLDGVDPSAEYATGEFVFLTLRTNETGICPYCAPFAEPTFKYDNGFCATSIPITGTVTLSLAKSVNTTQVQQGQPLTYTIAYTNSGSLPLGNIWIWDDVDRELAYVTAASGSPAVISDTQVAWNIGDVPPYPDAGSTGVLTFSVEVDGNGIDLADQTPIVNHAFFGVDPTDVPINPAYTSTVTSYVQAPVIQVSKSDGLDLVPAGDTLTYTLQITNLGHMTATGVVITDALPSEIGGAIQSWSLPDLAPLGGWASLDVPATVLAATVNDAVLTNTMTAEYQNPAGYTYDRRTATDTTAVRATAWLLDKNGDPDPVVAGTVLTYTLSYLNNTVHPAHDVSLTDTLPSGVTFGAVVEQTATWPSFTIEPGPPETLTWYTPTLAPGMSGSFVFTTTVSPDTSSTLVNSANITGTIDAVPTYTLAVASTAVDRQADVSLDKSDEGLTATAGRPFTYTLRVSNRGPSNATGIVVTDTLAAGTSFVSASGASCTATGADLACTPFDIAFGEDPVIITIVVDVAPSVPHSTILHNIAAARGSETDPNDANNTDEEFTYVNAEADLTLVKTVLPTEVAAGATLTYTLVYTNAGPSDAQSVQITDTLSPKVSFGGVVYADPALPDPSQAGQQIAWSISALSADSAGTIVYTVTVQPDASGLVTNTAVITSTTTDPVPGDNTASAEANVGAPDRATLYGYVFEDADCDGLQGPGEPGIPGVTVTLDGGLSATTGADGLYLFFLYDEGIHTVVETDPDGYFSTTPNEVHVDVAFANTHRVDFGDGPGSASCAAIHGTVFEDLDGSRSWDSGEPGIQGVTVTLEYSTTVFTVETDLYGSYSFSTTVTGTHWVREIDPDGYFSTTPNDVPIDVSWGNGYTVNFGDAQLGSPFGMVFGTVFDDQNHNGLWDTGEFGIPGVQISSTLAAASPVFTDENGEYGFRYDLAGTATLTETNSAHYVSTTPDVVQIGIATGSENGSPHDFGDFLGIMFVGQVFDDTNADGEKDELELGVADAVITASAPLGAADIYTTTASGAFTLYHTVSGTLPITVTEADPAGYVSTNSQPGDDVSRVDANTLRINLPISGTIYSGDFGDVQASSAITISGWVWDDRGTVSCPTCLANGVFDPGEPFLPGAVITLTSGLTQTTGADGAFQLYGPPETAITIIEGNPEGYVSTNAIAGSPYVTKVDNDTLFVSPLPGGATAADNYFGDVTGTETAIIGGTVYDDANENGQLDGGESGLQGVTVTLEFAGEEPIVVQTDTGGHYQFAVAPGTQVRISSAGPGGDFYPTTVETLYLTPPAAGAYLDNDFGYSDDTDTSVIFGIVFDDYSNDGLQNDGEVGLAGAVITLTQELDTLAVITTTGDGLITGTFTFSVPRPFAGQVMYDLKEKNPPGYRSTTPDWVAVPLTPATPDAEVKFGDTNRLDTATILGTVFDDLDADGERDTGEPGLAGVAITTTCTISATGETVGGNAATDQYGQYTVGLELPSEAYCSVIEQDPAQPGYHSTTPDLIALRVEPGSSYVVDFGDSQSELYSIVGTVFDDHLNGDGLQDMPWELGIPGVTVTLSTGETTTTGAYGQYNFPVADTGITLVIETDKAGYHSTTPNTVPVNVTTAEEVYVVNFGDRLDSQSGISFYGAVFEDESVDGIWDPITELGIPGVTVEITGTTPISPDSYVTNEWGQYTFLITATGTFTVTEVDLEGYVSTIAVPGDPTVSWVDDNTLVADVASLTPGRNLGDNLFGDAQRDHVIAISGTVWDDNGQGTGGIANDGLRNGDEPGLAGAYVALSSGLDWLTGADGTFVLYAPPGVPITLTEANPAGYLSSNAIPGNNAAYVDDDTLVVTGLSGGGTSSDNLFGDVLPADLEIVKSGAPEPVDAGTTLTYTLIYTNHGPSYAQSVVITDTLDPSVSFGGMIDQPDAASGPIQSGDLLTWSVPELAADDSGTIIFTVTVDTDVSTGSQLDNSVEISSNMPDTLPGNNADDIQTGVKRLADVSIAKSDDGLTAIAGEPFDYTLTVSNAGPSDASDIVVTDTLPAGMTFSSASGATCSAVGQMVSCQPFDIAYGAPPVAITISVEVAPGVAHGAELENTATALAAEADPNEENNTATETTPVDREADVSVAKSDGGLTAIAGEPFDYALTVSNAGPSDASDIVVTDTLPAGMTFSSASGATCSAVGQTVSCQPFDVAYGGAPVVITISVDVAPWLAHDAELENTAAALAAEDDPDEENNTDIETTPIERRADLAVEKSADPELVAAGVPLTYTISITNLGPSDATGATVSDPIPEGVTFDSQDASQGSYNPSSGLWTVGDLPLDASATLTLVVTVDSATTGAVINTATAAGNEIDPVPANDSVTISTPVTLKADLALTKTDDPNPVLAGRLLTYTLTVANEGPSDATDVQVSDAIPAGTTFESQSASQGVYNDLSGVWTVGSLADGADVTLTLVVTVDSDTLGSVSNTAEVAGGQYDPFNGNNTATILTAVETEADLSITKGDDPEPVVAGLTLTYTLAFANAGPSDALDVEIADILSEDVAFGGVVSQEAALSGPIQTAQLLTWTLPRLAAGDAGSIVFTVTVTDTAIVTIANHVAIDSVTFDPETGDNTAREETGITCLPDAYEDDDIPGSAAPLLANQTQVHSFCQDPTDWSLLTVTAGHIYTVTTSSWGRRADTYLAIYDRDGTALLAANDDYEGSTDHSSRIVWQAPQSGTYYVRTSSRADLTGNLTDYDIWMVHDESSLIYLPIVSRGYVGAVPDDEPASNAPAVSQPEPSSPAIPAGVISHACMDDYEVDDTWELAMPIADGETQIHSFDSDPVRYAADKDFVSFELFAGRTITFTTQVTNTVTLMELYDREGYALDVSGTDQLVWTPTESGIYFLGLSPQTDAFGCADEVGYRLHVEMLPRWYIYLPLVLRSSTPP